MRLVTRADLDGLACSLIISDNEGIDELVLIEPQKLTDRLLEIQSGDIVANLPYAPGCGKWFDHHLLTPSNPTPPDDFDGVYRQAPSAARLVWEYYGEDPRYRELIEETDRFDSAQLSREDVLQPQGYVLLGFTVDPRTGFGDDDGFFRRCLEWLRHEPVRQVLLEPEVGDRIVQMFEQNEEFCWLLMDHSQSQANVVFTDLRGVENPPPGNRFLIYTLFPEANVSVRAEWEEGRERVMLKVGHSIFDRSCQTSVGELMSGYGGGGHRGAGSAPLGLLEADVKILEIIETLRTNG